MNKRWAMVMHGGAALLMLGVATAAMPPVVDPSNVYSENASGKMNPAVAQDLQRVYVPNLRSHEVHVIDPTTLKVVDRFKVGMSPQVPRPANAQADASEREAFKRGSRSD